MKKHNIWRVIPIIMVLSIMIALPTIQTVNAQEDGDKQETSVEMILEDIKGLNMKEDEVRQEIGSLTVNEMNSIKDYLEEKPDITVREQQVLEIIYEVTYGDNKFIRVEQDTIKGKDERDASIRDAKELVDGYTQDEKFEMYEILQEKREDDRTEEENILLDAIKEDFNDKYMGTFIKIAIALIIAGIVLTMVDAGHSMSMSDGFFGIIGTVLLAIGIALGLLLLGGTTYHIDIVKFFN